MTEQKTGTAGEPHVDHFMAKLSLIVDEFLKTTDMTAAHLAFSVAAVVGTENRVARRQKLVHYIAIAADVLGKTVNDLHHCFGAYLRLPARPVD